MSATFSTTLLLVILLVCCCYEGAVGEVPRSCCLRVKNKEIPKQMVKSYEHQRPGEGCAIEAMVFETRKGISLCAPVNSPWVDALVEELNKRCRRRQFKGKHCKPRASQ